LHQNSLQWGSCRPKFSDKKNTCGLTKILVPFATRLTTPLISNKHSGSLVPWSASAARIYLAVWIAAAAAAVG